MYNYYLEKRIKAYREDGITLSYNKCSADLAWSEYVRMFEYKAMWYGRTIIKVDSFYPSSQICSVCGYRNEKVKDLGIRQWECPNCGASHDRDVNASKNILREGRRIVGIA